MGSRETPPWQRSDLSNPAEVTRAVLVGQPVHRPGGDNADVPCAKPDRTPDFADPAVFPRIWPQA